jgi:hypothetical protein
MIVNMMSNIDMMRSETVKNAIDWLNSQEGRQARYWLYQVVRAGIPVLSMLGYVQSDDLPVWNALLVALLGITFPTVAIENLPPKTEPAIPLEDAA